MKARLYVVDSNSLQDTLNNMEITISVPSPESKSQWKPILVDIMSDLFQIEIEDYAFLWETGKIHGVYRIVSKPYFITDAKDSRIFGLKIEHAYSFANPIREYDVLNSPALKGRMWNVAGKKLAGKSRGTTPLTEDELSVLIQMLSEVNDKTESRFYPFSGVIDVQNELVVNMQDNFFEYTPKTLNTLDIEKVTLREGRRVKYEKSLELILNYLFREKDFDTLSKIDIDINKVLWFANYLPYGIERSEIDYMVMESDDGSHVNKIDVIELMRGKIDPDHINRCFQYSRWVIDAICNGIDIISPVLICGRTSKITGPIEDNIEQNKTHFNISSIRIYTYEIINGMIEFNRIY